MILLRKTCHFLIKCIRNESNVICDIVLFAICEIYIEAKTMKLKTEEKTKRRVRLPLANKQR